MPLKRHKALVQLSREHHHALLLCWKIRNGLKKNIDINRIFNYADWFYINHLKPHFNIEEKCLFVILGTSHILISEAISQHKELQMLFEKEERNISNLILIAQQLENHVRFEERQVFEEIQNKASEEQLLSIIKNNIEKEFVENNEDKFWE